MSNILTLQIDPDAQAFFEALRRQYFPPERNHIPAHITLFHTLPDTPAIAESLARSAATQPRFRISVTGLRSLGRGVAYTLASSALQALHRNLADTVRAHLSAQDIQPFRPHIVVQNKATPEQARNLLTHLEQSFHTLDLTALGLDLWRYLGGPWQHLQTFSFDPKVITPDPKVGSHSQTLQDPRRRRRRAIPSQCSLQPPHHTPPIPITGKSPPKPLN